VIKVESATHADVLRTSPPFKDGKAGINRSGYFSNYNAGKYSISLNLRMPRAIEIARMLMMWADVVVEGFRPGIMQKWGLDYEGIKKERPDLIMVSTNMLGQSGPHCQYRGFGQHGAAIAGWGLTIGWPDRPAVAPFGAYSDYISARFVVIAILGALEYRRKTGKGQYIDNSQVECSIDFLAPLILDYSAHQRLMRVQGNHDPYASPHGAYRCKGVDRWCVLSVSTDEEWDGFCKVIGAPPWTKDPRFATLVSRKENEGELDRLVEGWTSNNTAEEITQRLQENGVPAGVLRNAEDIFNDPQLRHRGHIKMLEQREMGLHAYESFGFRLSKTPGEPRTGAPCMGEHNEYVCTKILGLSDEEFVELITEGVLE
jgi:benzylsuccinate CoA-transferase BbsF subunit